MSWGFLKAFIFRENYVSDTKPILVLMYSMFPKPVSKTFMASC